MKTFLLLGTTCLLVFFSWIYMTQPLIMGVPDTRKAVPVDTEALRMHVQTLSVTLAPRDAEHPTQLDVVADYIRDTLSLAGGVVTEQSYDVASLKGQNTLSRRGAYRNIIASFGPSDGERLIVGAHYDSYGTGPGADDNASGVAGLLELGRLLGKTPPRIRTDLIAWTLEEPPYFGTQEMGSAVHAASLAKAHIRVRGVICLEMIGYFNDQPHSQSYPMALLKLFYPSQGNFIGIVGGFADRGLARSIKQSFRETVTLPVASLNGPETMWGIGFSDQRSYWPSQIPAVMITDTAFFRNTNYHTPRDTQETLDFNRMAQVIQGVFQAIDDLAHD